MNCKEIECNADVHVKSRQLCKSHYQKMMYRRYRPERSNTERFWDYVVIAPGCWLWSGAITGKKSGPKYGHFRNGNTHVMAHRYMYELMFTKIPSRLQIDHVCNVSICVNPKHLELVTPQENIARRDLRKKRKVVL